jgi:hypothetical protein
MINSPAPGNLLLSGFERSNRRRPIASAAGRAVDSNGSARRHAAYLEHVNPYGRFELDMETRLDLSLNGPGDTIVGSAPVTDAEDDFKMGSAQSGRWWFHDRWQFGYLIFR